jgi:hypothetical protein
LSLSFLAERAADRLILIRVATTIRAWIETIKTPRIRRGPAIIEGVTPFYFLSFKQIRKTAAKAA